MLARFSAMMKTTAARLSALYLLLFSVCAIFLVFYMTHLAAGFLMNQTRESLNQEIVGLARSYNNGGVRALVREIDRRSRRPDAFVYLVADNAGRIISGNIAQLEPGILEHEGWTEEPFRYTRFGDDDDDLDSDRGPRAIAQVIQLNSGLRIVVGKDLRSPLRFRGVVRQSLGIGLGIMGLGGLLIWVFVGRRALKRIDSVSAASARIVGGDLSERLPVSPSNDEFDRLSTSLNGMLGRIENLNQGLRDVSDSIAHDLKTPLTRLRNRAEEALRGKKSNTQYREALNDMIAESDHLIRIFNAMLLISRVEAGYSKHTTEAVALSNLASDLAELYDPVIEDAGGTLATEIQDNLVVEGNRDLIGQALTNLIDNAVKYCTHENPQIKITGHRSPDGRSVELIVEDNGPGIDEENHDRVLKRFVRLDESRSEAGSGLGLSLVSAIMSLHKGEISFSDAQPGLRVVLSFPLTQVKAVGAKKDKK